MPDTEARVLAAFTPKEGAVQILNAGSVFEEVYGYDANAPEATDEQWDEVKADLADLLADGRLRTGEMLGMTVYGLNPDDPRNDATFDLAEKEARDHA